MAKDLEYYLAQARRIAEHREAGAEKEIRKLYKSLMKDLQQFMSETYVRYAEEDKLTYAMLQKAGYDARFLEEIEQRINIASPAAAKKLKKLVEDTYEAAYSGMVNAVAKQGGSGLDAAFADSVAITPEQIRAAVENPVSGLTLSDTLEKNRKEIVYSIKRAVGVGLMNGDRYTTVARRIAEHVDGDYKKAVAIARTETHRVREAGNNDAAVSVDKELQNGTSGLRMVKTWKTMKDERVRPQQRRKGKKGWTTRIGKGANHMAMEGQTVLANEKFDLGGGITADAPGNSGNAGNDINCRCYASYEMMDDAAYFKKTGKHFPGYRAEEPEDFFSKWKRRQDEYDYEIDDILDARGFDGLPKVVSEQEFDDAVAQANGFYAVRGYKAPNQEALDLYREELYRGKWYVDCRGGSRYGRGMYGGYTTQGKLTDELRDIAEAYGRGGYVEIMTLAKDAKTITYRELEEKCEQLRKSGKHILLAAKAYGFTPDETLYLVSRAGGSKLLTDKERSIARKVYDEITEDRYDEIEEAARAIRSTKLGTSEFAALLGYDAVLVEDEGYVVFLNRTKIVIRGA